ncbi:hypothetical protein AB0D08_34585 [Kitasatospora sp. NPDC048540]|uniref:hypothetical protein n=1 Tax=Kitasatospora sp. NPDC048540 TaxID=3155634 RepID=UPI0033DBC407
MTEPTEAPVPFSPADSLESTRPEDEAISPRPHREARQLWWALCGFTAGAAAVTLLWGVSASGLRQPAPSTATFGLMGTLALTDGAVATDDGCAGQGADGDVRRGADVTVYDEDGTIVALGALGGGTLEGTAGCRFTLGVTVPLGPRFFQIEVGRRDRLVLTDTEAQSGRFTRTIH